MARLTAVPGKPGWFKDLDTGEITDISIDREDDVYDTEAIASGAVPLDHELALFKTTRNKRKLDSNASAEKRAVAKSQVMALERIGVQIPTVTGNIEALPSDIKKVIEGGYLLVKLGSTVIAEGPGIKFPSGYGLAGNSVENQQGVVSNGNPATAAAAKLSKEFRIDGDTEVEVTYTFHKRTAFVVANLTGGLVAGAGTETPNISVLCAVRCYLHGRFKAAATQN